MLNWGLFNLYILSNPSHLFRSIIHADAWRIKGNTQSIKHINVGQNSQISHFFTGFYVIFCLVVHLRNLVAIIHRLIFKKSILVFSFENRYIIWCLHQLLENVFQPQYDISGTRYISSCVEDSSVLKLTKIITAIKLNKIVNVWWILGFSNMCSKCMWIILLCSTDDMTSVVRCIIF